MSLPPAEKLPLALRKNIRDQWESRKAELEGQLSEIMGTPWTCNFNPLELFPYATDSRGLENMGDVFADTVTGIIKFLGGDFHKSFGDPGIGEVNFICYAHTVTMGYRTPEPQHFLYKGCDVVDGQLRVIFKKGTLGSDMWGPLRGKNLEWALQYAAPQEGSTMNYVTRAYIRTDWDAEVGKVLERIQKILDRKDIVFEPNWDTNWVRLTKEAQTRNTELSRFTLFDGLWERDFGGLVRKYFDGLAFNLKKNKFDEDEMLREGFNEVVPTGKIAFRIVEEMKDGQGAAIEDGMFYIQVTPAKYDKIPSDASSNVLDLL